MKTKVIPKSRKSGTVVILGAGASYGSTKKNPPPLMASFIRDGKNRVKTDYSKLWSFLESIGFSLDQLDSGYPNIEQVYSTLHILSNALWYESEADFIKEIGVEFSRILPVDLIESFILEVVNSPSLNAIKKTCRYHDALVSNLRDGDTIISFNYDLICDASLRKHRRWTELYGYGFPCFSLLADHAELDTDTPSEIALLKPHGSLNWRLQYSQKPITIKLSNQNSIPPVELQTFHEKLFSVRAGTQPKILVKMLKEIKNRAYNGLLASHMSKLYDKLTSTMSEAEQWKIPQFRRQKRTTCIVPPTIYKFGNPDIPIDLVTVWSAMKKALSIAGRIVCIGYSFPDGDVEFATLFRLAALENKCKRLRVQIVNPDPDVQTKIKAMAPSATVDSSINTLEEYVS